MLPLRCPLDVPCSCHYHRDHHNPERSITWKALQVGRVEVKKPLPRLQEKSAPHHDAAPGAAPVPPEADVPQGGVSRH